ncbi:MULTISPECIES: TonB-dependent receptor plug domain-containing protein [unclassified Pseudoalteromonas]|uniref:TonB-dependent receptor plug domain-containing protein n=1 Tax=unclassified Pseudoalteromonas TaxID=194690 RepID=UPI00301427FA
MPHTWPLVIFSCLLFAPSCLALDDLYSLSLEELQDVKVTIATKTDTQLKYTPSSVSYFSQQHIRDLGITTLTELFAHIPGFYPMYNPVEGNESYLIARGHPQKYANTLLLLINGQRINEDYTGGINYIDRFISLHNVERVEVVRGPGSTLYGSNAFNGVVNIITKTENYITLGVGSFSQRTLNLGATYQGETISAGFDGHFYQDDGDTLGNVFDRFLLQDATNDAHEAQQLEAFVSAYGVTFNTRYHRSARDSYYLFRRLRDGTTKHENQHWLSRLGYQYTVNDSWAVKAALEYSKATRKSLTALELQGNAPFNNADFLFGEDFTYDSYRAIVDSQYFYSDSQTWSAGIELVESQVPEGYLRSNYDLYSELEYLNQIVTFTQPGQRVVLPNTRRIKMAYLQLESVWSEHWRTTFGLRRDSYNDVAGRTNPRGAVIYTFDDHHLFKLLYGEAYRAPSLGDLYDEESGLTVGNRTLRPTTLKATELVYQYTGNSLSFSLSLFHNHIDDLIDFSSSGDAVFLGNIANNKATGVEIEWHADLSQYVDLKGTFSHLFSNDTEINPDQSKTPSEDLVPRTHAMTSIVVKPSERWRGSLSVHSRSGVKVLQQFDDSWTVAAAINYQYSENALFSLDINNLLDSNYHTAAIIPLGIKDSREFSSFQARGREIKLSYRYQF